MTRYQLVGSCEKTKEKHRCISTYINITINNKRTWKTIPNGLFCVDCETSFELKKVKVIHE